MRDGQALLKAQMGLHKKMVVSSRAFCWFSRAAGYPADLSKRNVLALANLKQTAVHKPVLVVVEWCCVVLWSALQAPNGLGAPRKSRQSA